jgi:iron-sulfur cluster assembly protein
MNVEFTPALINHLKKVYPEMIDFFLSIRKVGCNGFAYDLKPLEPVEGKCDFVWISERDNMSAMIPEERTAVFDGAKFDYVREGLNYKMKVTNPNVKGTCGCGESFNLV